MDKPVLLRDVMESVFDKVINNVGGKGATADEIAEGE